MQNRWLGFMMGAALGAGRLAFAARRPRRKQDDLRGQVALVTGGTRGLGFLIARELARQGCDVAICARSREELARASADLEREGGQVLAVKCDVSRQAQVEAMIDMVTARFGQIDILVNNAGIIQGGPVVSMTLEDFEEAMAVMYWGTVYTTLAVLPQMRERRMGRIVNITSIGGKVSIPHLLPYSAAKFATVGLSEGLRAELAKDGIIVTTIAPGLMRTGSHLNAFFKGKPLTEFGLFSLIGTQPVISMDAERAARQVVKALRRGEAERVLSIPATLLAHFHGAFPALTTDILALVNRALPDADGPTEKRRGMAMQDEVTIPFFNQLTRWGLSAARRFHQFPAPAAAAEAGETEAEAEQAALAAEAAAI